MLICYHTKNIFLYVVIFGIFLSKEIQKSKAGGDTRL